MIKPRRVNKPAKFLLKLFHIVNLPASDDLVCWDNLGEKIIIKNEGLFLDQIMKVYFKMEQFSSFKR